MVTMATTARGRLRPPLMPSPAMDMVMDTAMVTDMDMAMEATDTDMAMDTTAIMARGRPRLPLMPSLAMDIMVMAMDMDMAMEATDMDTAMEATDMDTMATMARGLLMLLPAMDTMVMDMDMVAMDTTDTATDMAMATTDKFLLFNAVESSVQTKNLDHLVLVLNF